MAAARVNKAPQGKEGVLFIEKGETPIMVGSTTNISYSHTTGTERFACREEDVEDYNGDHEASVTLQGFVFYRPTASRAANFDAMDFEAAQNAESLLTGYLTSGKEDDVMRSGDFIITDFSEEQPQSGRQTYSVTLKFKTGKPVITLEEGEE